MTFELPEAISEYFAADKGDGGSVSRCFTEDGVVVDEGRIYTGRSAISQWRSQTSSQYNYTSTPTAIRSEHETVIVTANVVGDFPRSPVDLEYLFVIENGKIKKLEII